MLRAKVYIFLCECVPVPSIWNSEPADRLVRNFVLTLCHWCTYR